MISVAAEYVYYRVINQWKLKGLVPPPTSLLKSELGHKHPEMLKTNTDILPVSQSSAETQSHSGGRHITALPWQSLI